MASDLTRPAPARQDVPFRGQGRRLGYVEDWRKARTPLADFFSILFRTGYR
jgi:hypothetical protein